MSHRRGTHHSIRPAGCGRCTRYSPHHIHLRRVGSTLILAIFSGDLRASREKEMKGAWSIFDVIVTANDVSFRA